MIYAAFTMWLFLLIFMGLGVYRLWAGMVNPSWLNWALLPGTVVSEMAYIFGCLITGGEIRRARLLDAPPCRDGRRRSNGAEATTEARPRWRILGPIVAALMALAACGAGILILHALLGEPVMEKFTILGGLRPLAKSLPTSWPALWEQLEAQLRVLRRMCETWVELDWLNWRVPLFVYVAACLAVRLSPGRRDMRFTLAAAVVVAGVAALVGALSTRFTHLIEDIWPLLTYVYANLLFFLAVTLVLRGLVLLVRALMGRGGESS